MADPPLARSTLRPWPRVLARIGLGLALIFALAFAGFAWWMRRDGARWLQRTARERLVEVVRKASVEGYHFTMDSVATDFWSGDLRITGMRLDFDTTLMDSLRNGAYKYLFAAEAGTIHLGGLSYWRLILLQEFHAERLQLEDPALRYFIGDEHVALNEPFERLRPERSSPLELLTIDSLIVLRARTLVIDPRGRLPVMRVAGLDVEAANVQLVHLPGNVHADLSMGAVELAVDSMDAEISAAYRLHIGQVALSGPQHRVTVADLALHHLPADSIDLVRTTVMDIHIARLDMEGIDIGHLIADRALEMTSLTVMHPVFHGRLDKRLPDGPHEPVRLPPAALQAIAFPLRIDTVHLVDGALLYEESNATTGAWGRLSFTALQATLTGIDNGPAQGTPRPGIDATIACTFLDSAALEARYDVTPDVSETFTFDAVVRRLPFHVLSELTEPLLRLKVSGGALERMHLAMRGDDNKMRGTMYLDYVGLHVGVVAGASEEERHSLFGDLLDHVLQADNGGGLTDERERSFAVEREKDRSFFTYLWQGTRAGLKRNLFPGIRERVTTVLKKEREQRRQQRARRRSAR